MAAPSRPTRVLIVDDSAIVRKMLADALRSEPDIEVVGLASDPFVARDLILRHDPDVLTLDIEMPLMDGLTFLRKLMVHHPLPVIIVSSVTRSGSKTSIDALAAGAIDVIAKPGGPRSVGEIAEKLKRRIRAISLVQPLQFAAAPPPVHEPSLPAGVRALSRAEGVIVIGASAGGTQAIEAVISRLPADTPPILVVQHMPALFTRGVRRNASTGSCPMKVVEAQRRRTPRARCRLRRARRLSPGRRAVRARRCETKLHAGAGGALPAAGSRRAVPIRRAPAARAGGGAAADGDGAPTAPRECWRYVRPAR